MKKLFYTLLTALVLFNSYSIYRDSPIYINGLIHKNADSIKKLEGTVKTNKNIVDKLQFNPADYMDNNVLIYVGGGSGSGSIIRADANTYILTAAHVVNAAKLVVVKGQLDTEQVPVVEITAVIKGKPYPAELVKIDDEVDVAVIKVKKKFRIVPLKIAEEEPKLGETVWTISNPGGVPDIVNKGVFSKSGEKYALVATAGYFGSSGGMALNTKGEQIGVISTVMMTRVQRFFPNITVYNGITKTKNLRKFLKGIL